MSAAFIQVAPDDASGKKVQTFENVISGETVEAQAVVLVDSSGVAYLPVTANSPISPDTKTKITYDAKGLVTAGADATTADIPDSTDKRYITDTVQDALLNAPEATLLGRSAGFGTGEVGPINVNTDTIEFNADEIAVVLNGQNSQLFYNSAGTFNTVSTTSTDGANLYLNGPIISDDFANGTRLIDDSATELVFQNTISNARTDIKIAPNGSVANYPSLLSLYSTNVIADRINISALFMYSKGASDTYNAIFSYAYGTGSRAALNIEANGSFGISPHLVLGTDTGVSIGTGTAAGANNLLVSGTITGSNLSGTHSGTSSGTNTGDQTLAGLGGTQAAIVPNTVPSAGQVLAGNAGGTAYAPVTLSGSGATATLSALGVLTLSAIANATLANSAMTLGGTSTALGGTQEILATTTRPTVSATIPANYSAVVGGDSFTLDSGITLTIASGANLTLV